MKIRKFIENLKSSTPYWRPFTLEKHQLKVINDSAYSSDIPYKKLKKGFTYNRLRR